MINIELFNAFYLNSVCLVFQFGGKILLRFCFGFWEFRRRGVNGGNG